MDLGFEIDDEDRIDYTKRKNDYYTRKGKYHKAENPEGRRVLKIDPKSSEPRKRQIQRQIQEFTRNENTGRSDMVSMDDMTDLIEVVKEYGEIDWAGEGRNKVREKYGKFS